jgi:HPt (histidine-containing phosphotransfer) domain-containing protein
MFFIFMAHTNIFPALSCVDTYALSEGDFVSAKRIAHSLKSISATLGITALQEIAKIIEYKINDWVPLDQLVDDIILLRTLLAAVGTEVNSMNT